MRTAGGDLGRDRFGHDHLPVEFAEEVEPAQLMQLPERRGVADDFRQLPKVAADAKVNWAKNGLQNSFVSYRYAITQNEHTVSAEAGNSSAMVFKNYRAIAPVEKAQAWFSIVPDRPANIVPVAPAATA